MKVSVAIPTYGRDEVLTATIAHVLALEPPADEVLVIDQTPRHEPATERRLEAWHRDGAIVWIRLPRPSIPHAMNEALRRASGDVVLYLDDDLVPARALVARHREALERSGADAVVGQILQPGERPGDTPPAAARTRLDDLEFRFNGSSGAFVTNVMAGNLSVRRERALAIGAFDERFTTTAYRFETDFAWRLAGAGGTIWFEPSASVDHLKAGRGGLRTWGEHLRSASPAHSTGDYYFALKHLRGGTLLGYVARRMRRSILSRFDVTHPWWIPLKAIREVRALIEARRLYAGTTSAATTSGSAAPR